MLLVYWILLMKFLQSISLILGYNHLGQFVEELLGGGYTWEFGDGNRMGGVYTREEGKGMVFVPQEHITQNNKKMSYLYQGYNKISVKSVILYFISGFTLEINLHITLKTMENCFNHT